MTEAKITADDVVERGSAAPARKVLIGCSALLFFVGIISLLAYSVIIGGPTANELAQAELHRARDLVKGGAIGDGAWIYAAIANTNVPAAAQASAELTALQSAPHRLPATACVEVFAAQLELLDQQRGRQKRKHGAGKIDSLEAARTRLYERAHAEAERRRRTSAIDAVRILHVVRKLAPDKSKLDGIIEELCHQAKEDGMAIDAAVELARLRWLQGDEKAVITLLAPYQNRIHNHTQLPRQYWRGALLLGLAYARTSEHERALSLLEDAADPLLQHLLDDWEDYRKATEPLLRAELKRVSRLLADDFDFESFAKAGEAEQRRLLYRYLELKVVDHPIVAVKLFRARRRYHILSPALVLLRMRLIAAAKLATAPRRGAAIKTDMLLKRLLPMARDRKPFDLLHGMLSWLLDRPLQAKMQWKHLLEQAKDDEERASLYQCLSDIGAHELRRELESTYTNAGKK